MIGTRDKVKITREWTDDKWRGGREILRSGGTITDKAV